MKDIAITIILIIMLDWCFNFSQELSDNFQGYYIDYIENTFTQAYGVDFIKNASYKKCEASLANSTIFYTMMKLSGKGKSDLGQYTKCSNDFQYYLIRYDVSFTKNDTIYTFLNRALFFYGLCIHSSCHELIILFNEDLKTQTQAYFNLISFEIKYNKIPSTTSFKDIFSNPKSLTAFILICFLILILFAKICLTIIFKLCFSSSMTDDANKAEEIEQINNQQQMIDEFSGESKEINELLNENSLLDNAETNDKILFPTLNKSHDQQKEDKSKEQLYSFQRTFFSFFNLSDNFRYLFSVTNEYYDDSKIQFIAFFRTVCLVLILFNNNFFIIMKNPSKNLYNEFFYESPWMVLLKISSFAINLWVILDGFEFVFKFMFYIKKNIEKINIWTFIKFYLLFIPKALVFYFTFFLFYYSLEGYTHLPWIKDLSPLLNYFVKHSVGKRVCIQNLRSFFNGWNCLYNDFFDNKREFSYCFKFVNIMYSTHICFLLVLLFLYISFKLKRKLFDYFILISYLILFGTSYLSCKNQQQKKYDIFYILGETCSMKYPHVLVVDYMTGVFGGLMYFYFIDLISSHPIESILNYHPFIFCYSLMKGLDSIPSLLKKIILLILALLLILINFIFYIAYKVNDSSFNFELNLFLKIFDQYEKKIVMIMLVLIMFLVQNKDNSFLRYLFEVRIFTVISRIGYVIFCSNEALMYLFYTGYNIQYYFNYNNLCFITYALTLYFIFVNMLLFLVIEQPVKMFMKFIGNGCQGKEPMNIAWNSKK